MNRDKEQQVVLAFIKRHHLAVIATVTSVNNPEAAVVEFSERENFELIFDTMSTFRKYENLQHNVRVAAVIGWDEDITVQYEGIAVELNGDELKEYAAIHIAKLPDSAKFLAMENIRYFKVIPKWIRYTDVSIVPWKTFELSF